MRDHLIKSVQVVTLQVGCCRWIYRLSRCWFVEALSSRQEFWLIRSSESSGCSATFTVVDLAYVKNWIISGRGWNEISESHLFDASLWLENVCLVIRNLLTVHGFCLEVSSDTFRIQDLVLVGLHCHLKLIKSCWHGIKGSDFAQVLLCQDSFLHLNFALETLLLRIL